MQESCTDRLERCEALDAQQCLAEHAVPTVMFSDCTGAVAVRKTRNKDFASSCTGLRTRSRPGKAGYDIPSLAGKEAGSDRVGEGSGLS